MIRIPRKLLSPSFFNLLGKPRVETCQYVRHYLSSAYRCEDAWQERLQSSVLNKIDVGNFAVRLQEKMDREGQVPAIDMDIFANKLELLDPYQLNFAANIFHRFRNTPQTSNATKSMSHAVIRALLKLNDIELLISVLNDKVKYGIFLDMYSANICMMELIDKGAFLNAGFIAIELMLMEDFGSDLNSLMAIYSCHMALSQTPHENLCQEVNPSEPEPEDEDWVKVNYLINPWYDDHWDLPTPSHRLGKTLTMATQHADLTTDTLSASMHIIGLANWQKFSTGIELIQRVADSDGKLAVGAFEQFCNLLNEVVTTEPEKVDISLRRLHHVRAIITQQEKHDMTERLEVLRGQLSSGDQLIIMDLTAGITTRLQAAQRLEENEHISSIKKLYQQWDTDRTQMFEQYIMGIEKQKEKISIAERLKRLTDTEEKLSFFDQQGKIEMGIRKGERLTFLTEIKEVAEEEQFVPPPQERGKAF